MSFLILAHALHIVDWSFGSRKPLRQQLHSKVWAHMCEREEVYFKCVCGGVYFCNRCNRTIDASILIFSFSFCFAGHLSHVTDVAWNPKSNGSSFASASTDATIKVSCRFCVFYYFSINWLAHKLLFFYYVIAKMMCGSVCVACAHVDAWLRRWCFFSKFEHPHRSHAQLHTKTHIQIWDTRQQQAASSSVATIRTDGIPQFSLDFHPEKENILAAGVSSFITDFFFILLLLFHELIPIFLLSSSRWTRWPCSFLRYQKHTPSLVTVGKYCVKVSVFWLALVSVCGACVC